MDLTNRTEIKNLLAKFGAKPEKYLGQHFLLSKRALRQMVETAEIKKGDIVVEVGPGIGALTQELAKTGVQIIAMEKDPLMIKVLRETLADYKNIVIIQTDARKIDWGNWDNLKNSKNFSTFYPQIPRGLECHSRPLGRFEYKIVANLPYNIANFLIRNWLAPLEVARPQGPSGAQALARPLTGLESKNSPERIVVMIQKEVAKRICARPPQMNLLAVSVQFYADAKIVNYVPAEVFWPKPKVDSAILLIEPRAQKPKIDQKRFFEILKAGFSQPRKQLAGNLVKKLKMPREKLISIFRDLDISEKTRAENLSVKEWLAIARKL